MDSSLPLSVGNGAVSILIVDPHPVMLRGIETVVRSSARFQVVGAVTSGSEACLLAENLHPSVVVMEIMLPDSSGLEIARELRSRSPETAILVFTGTRYSHRVSSFLKLGAKGYVHKNCTVQELLSALDAVASGRTIVNSGRNWVVPMSFAASLTTRETAVLKGMLEGLRNREIGDVLSLSERTVEQYVGNILRKLHAKSRAEAISRFYTQGPGTVC